MSVNSIYHLRMIKPPKIKFIILLVMFFMALMIINLNQKYIVTYEDEVIIQNNEFIITENIKGPIYLNDQKVTIISKESKSNYVIYRISEFKDGPVKIKYPQKVTILKFIKNL